MRALSAVPPLVSLLLWTSACAEPGPAAVDIERYNTLLTEGWADPEQALGVCLSLRDPALAGDCAMTVAVRASSGPNQDPASWCQRVPEGTWRDECRFEGAELQLRRNLPEKAAALCRSAGPFADDCGMHLWMNELDRLTWGMSTAEIGARLPQAEALYQRWYPVLYANTDIEQRFWRLYYQRAFGSRASVDLRVCAALEPTQRARCETAGADLFVSQLAPFLQQTGRLREFCMLQAPSAELVAPWLGAVPHEALTRPLVERQAQLCEAPSAPAGAPNPG